jgi:hypothetical protein
MADALLDVKIPNLVNGVSQQAETLRYPSQCTESINALPSVLSGLGLRPHSNFIANLAGFPNSDVQVLPIDRSPTQRYLLVLGSQIAKVWDLAGNSYPVKRPDGTVVSSSDLTYLTTSTPRASLKAVTVADYTVVLNKEKTVALSSTPSASKDPEALVMVKQLRRGSNYQVDVYNSPTGTTPDWTAAVNNVETNIDSGNLADPLAADQKVVADLLWNALVTAGMGTTYDVLTEGALIYIHKKDGTDFRVDVKCSLTEGMSCFKGPVQNFSMLPKRSWAGFRALIAGDPEQNADDYYLEFQPAQEGATGWSEGSWVESKKAGLVDAFDATTLPHALLNMGSFFQWKPLTWSERRVGDLESNPSPSFVGKKINDVFFHRGRLGFLADENVILSESGEFFNFWRTTVIQLLDGDLIDIASTESTVSVLNSAVAVGEELILFSSKIQFRLYSDTLLTPKTASLKAITNFDNLEYLRPLGVGDSAFFCVGLGNSIGVSEYGVRSDTGKYDAYNTTEHCPNYIKGSALRALACQPENTFILHNGESSTNRLYVYRYFKRQDARLQSAWGKYKFEFNVIDAAVFGTDLYLISDGIPNPVLEVVHLASGLQDAELNYAVGLDRRMTQAQVVKTYLPDTDETEIELPTEVRNPRLVLVQSSGRDNCIELPTSGTGQIFRVQGDQRYSSFYVGMAYTMSVELTRPALRKQTANGVEVITSGRFQVRRGSLTFNDSVSFRVRVKAIGRAEFTKDYSSFQLGDEEALLGSPAKPRDGSFEFPVFAPNDQVTITLEAESPFPANLLSLNWEALYTVRNSPAQ